MATGTQVTAQRRRFLEALAESCNVRASAQVAGVSVQALYAWRARHQGFARAWGEALRAGYEQLEERLLRHALACCDAAAGEAIDADRQRMTTPELQLAMFLLNRYRAAVTPEAAGSPARRKARADDTERRLQARIDAVMRRRSAAE